MLGALALAVSGCSWFTDFERQPSIKPWEPLSENTPPRGHHPYSVPIYGSYVPGYAISYQPLPATIDSFTPLRNPIPRTDSSLALGRRYYAINCAVCHGDDGAGNGPVTKYGMPAINLLTDVTRGRSDGYIFGMIRNGRGLMPSYNRIEETDRWHVVNYLRGLQGTLPDRPVLAGRSQVATGPLGLPGEGGNTLPGYTVRAPSRPAPTLHNSIIPLNEVRARRPGPDSVVVLPPARDRRGTTPRRTAP